MSSPPNPIKLPPIDVMDLFARLKKIFAPLTKDDPFFGQIRFQKAGFWEAKRHFAPEGREYEMTIAGGETRPTASQRDFYRELEARYPGLKAEIAQELLAQLRNWREELAPPDVWAYFSLESFGLPDLDAGETIWELIYELKDDGHLFCVVLDGWAIRGIRIEG